MRRPQRRGIHRRGRHDADATRRIHSGGNHRAVVLQLNHGVKHTNVHQRRKLINEIAYACKIDNVCEEIKLRSIAGKPACSATSPHYSQLTVAQYLMYALATPPITPSPSTSHLRDDGEQV